jgi:Protein phosphatase 2C
MLAVHVSGASVRGPAHLSQSRPNEDAWRKAAGPFGAVLVVSDGVGSSPRARLGAEMVCRAVCGTVRSWSGRHVVPSRLFEQIESDWRRRIAPVNPHDSAATCLFAWIRPNGRVIVAGKGDGMAVVAQPPRMVRWVVGPRVHGFGNETAALGTTVDGQDWKHWTLKGSSELAIVLATDGVSDDLVPERISDFVTWLVEQMKCRAPQARSRAIRRQLLSWPTPNHLDDKTLAVLLAQRARRR